MHLASELLEGKELWTRNLPQVTKPSEAYHLQSLAGQFLVMKQTTCYHEMLLLLYDVTICHLNWPYILHVYF